MSAQLESTPLHPLLQRLLDAADASLLDAAGFDDWAKQPGRSLLVFTEDPLQVRETLDLAVIVPELARTFAGRFRTGVLPPAAARALAVRYGLRRWPALVMLADGEYVGAIEGLRDWPDYLDELTTLLAAGPTRPPSIGVAVCSANPNLQSDCH